MPLVDYFSDGQLTFSSGEAPPDLNSGRGVDGDCGLVVKCCSRFHEREEEGRVKATQGSLTQVLIVRILGKLNCTVSHGVVGTQNTHLTVCKGHIKNELNRPICWERCIINCGVLFNH